MNQGSPHNNDADSRPSIYLFASSKEGSIEVNVTGGEGEKAHAIERIAEEKLAELVETRNEIDDGENKNTFRDRQ